jgi:hypothetical protein
MADQGGSEGEGQDRINRLVALIIDGGYNLGMPSVRLTIVVHQDQVASLDRLEHICEERRTPIRE